MGIITIAARVSVGLSLACERIFMADMWLMAVVWATEAEIAKVVEVVEWTLVPMRRHCPRRIAS